MPLSSLLSFDHIFASVQPSSILHRLPRPVSHFLGYRPPLSLHDDHGHEHHALPPLLITLHSTLSTFLTLLLLSSITHFSSLSARYPAIIPSLGAGAVLNLCLLDTPSGQPRPTVLGQLVSAIIGVAISRSQLEDWLAAPLAAALAVLAMRVLGCVHPPGGATAILAATSLRDAGWELVGVVMSGVGLMLVCGCILGNIGRRWPVWWWDAHTQDDRTWDAKESVTMTERVCTCCGRG